MKVFEKEIVVQESDIDNLRHVNNVVYLQWVQDVASAHWITIASEEMKKKYAWVVLKHEIEYMGQAFLGDRIHVKTWVEWSEGFRSERQVEFRNLTNKKLLVKAKTTWCLLDGKSMKPRKIEEDIKTIFH